MSEGDWVCLRRGTVVGEIIEIDIDDFALVDWRPDKEPSWHHVDDLHLVLGG